MRTESFSSSGALSTPSALAKLIPNPLFREHFQQAMRTYEDSINGLHKHFFNDSQFCQETTQSFLTLYAFDPEGIETYAKEEVKKNLRIAALTLLISTIEQSNSALVQYIQRTFTLPTLQRVFRLVGDFTSLGERQWGVLVRYAQGVAYLTACLTRPIKEPVITAAGHYAGEVHATSGDAPGKVALCYEYLYRLLTEKPLKTRREELVDRVREGMIESFPTLLQEVRPLMEGALGLLQGGERGKKRRRRRERRKEERGEGEQGQNRQRRGRRVGEEDEVARSLLFLDPHPPRLPPPASLLSFSSSSASSLYFPAPSRPISSEDSEGEEEEEEEEGGGFHLPSQTYRISSASTRGR